MASAAHDRLTSVTFRLSPDDLRLLRQEALERGLTQQQWFEDRMLGGARPVRRTGRPRKLPSHGQEVLPQTA